MKSVLKSVLNISLSLAALSAILFVGNVRADSGKWLVGQQLGVMSTAGVAENTSGVGYGIEIQRTFLKMFRAGFEWQSTSHDIISSAADGAHLTTNAMMFTADVMIGGLHRLYFGPREGWVILNNDGSKNVRYSYGGQVGADFEVTEDFSVGPEMTLTYIPTDGIRSRLFAFVVPMKFHF